MTESKDEAKGQLHPLDSVSKSVDAYGNLSRGLTSEELAQTGTQKLILNDLSKAEAKVRQLEPFLEKYYMVLIEKNTLEGKLSKSNKSEILYSFCITSGGIIIGLAKIFVDHTPGISSIMIAIGSLLIIGGILFKFKK